MLDIQRSKEVTQYYFLIDTVTGIALNLSQTHANQIQCFIVRYPQSFRSNGLDFMRKGIPKGVSWAQSVLCHRSQSAYRLPCAITRLAAITEYLLAREISFWYPPGFSERKLHVQRATRSNLLRYLAADWNIEESPVVRSYLSKKIQFGDGSHRNHSKHSINLVVLLSILLSVSDNFPKGSFFHKLHEDIPQRPWSLVLMPHKFRFNKNSAARADIKIKRTASV